MTTYTWGSAASGLWTDAANWLTSGAATLNFPNYGDAALIAVPGAYTVSIGAVAVDLIDITDPATTLTVTGTVFAGDTAAGGLVNAGSITIAAGQTLIAGSLTTDAFNNVIDQGSFANTGAISLGAGALLRIDAATTTANLGSIAAATGTLQLVGTLDNTGATLSTSNFGTVQIGGVVHGGTLMGDAAPLLLAAYTPPYGYTSTIAPPTPELDGVTLRGSVTIQGVVKASGSLNVLPPGGAGPGTLAVGGELEFQDIVTSLDNMEVQIGPPGATSQVQGITAADQLNLGPNLHVDVGSLTPPGLLGKILTSIAIDNAGTVVSAGALAVTTYQGVTNSGTFEATLGGSITFASTGSGAQIVNTGVIAVDGGSVQIGSAVLSGTGTLALGGGGLITADALSGTQAVSFSGGGNRLVVTTPGDDLRVTGFSATDSIVIGSNLPAAFITNSNGTITEMDQDGGLILHAVMQDVPVGTQFRFDTVFTGYPTPRLLVTLTEGIPCFAAGTRIATPQGEVPVEALHPGDLVRSAFGGTVPIEWIGRRTLRAAAMRNPAAIFPIRIAASAITPGVPTRDLFVSPDHALYLDGVLVPAGLLVNGSTITRVPVEEVTYLHLELPQHDVVLAEGALCESYLDTGNRAEFNNAPPAPRAEEDANVIWLSRACAPQCRNGPRLDAIRATLSVVSSMLQTRALRAS